MLIFIPVMIIVTISLTFLFATQQDYRATDVSISMANNFSMIHEYRVQRVLERDVRDGPFLENPGYPFNNFSEYYTEVDETGERVMIITWPIPTGGLEILDNRGQDVLDNLQGRFGRQIFAANYVPNAGGSGGRVGPFEIEGLDRMPQPGDPVLMFLGTRRSFTGTPTPPEPDTP